MFKGVLPATLKLIRQRNVVESAAGDTPGDGALDYTMGDVRAAEGMTTVDVSVWLRK